jgi:stage II sporulation protein D
MLQALLNPLFHTSALAAQRSTAELPARKTGEEDSADRRSATRPRTLGKGEVKETRTEGSGTDGPIIRVGLISDATTVTLNSASGLLVRGSKDDDSVEAASDDRVRVELRRQAKPPESKSPDRDRTPTTGSRSRLQVEVAPVTEVVAYRDGKTLRASEERLIIVPSRSDGLVRVGDRSYRGEIHLVINARNRINVVNFVAVEQYLRGVVPLELSPVSFPAIEALKAQAVAARTYAISTRGRFESEGYDLRDDARSQVYGGASAEHALTDRAVMETRGIIAAHLDELGKARPIEALYMSTCGGQTEDNELVFGGKPIPYLRSVICSPDRRSLAGSEIVSGRVSDPLLSGDGRRLAREWALLDVLGFDVARRASARRLDDEADESELKRWLEHTARVIERAAPRDLPDEVTRLGEFARALASIIYGEGHARLRLAAADADYMLAGLQAESLSRESRVEVALLIKEGLLPLPASIDWRGPVTRSLAIETIGRALLAKSQTAALKSVEGASIRGLLAGGATTESAEGGRLRLASAGTAVNSQTAAKRERGQYTAREVVARDPAGADSREATRVLEQVSSGLEVDGKAWLFRRLGGESYPVNRVTLIGGERVTYHVNRSGRVDFLEIEPSPRGASSDRFSNVAEWRERISVEELGRRLKQSRVGVGQVEELKPMVISASNRVIELEVIGTEGRTLLRNSQVRTALNLKESLFVIDREKDARGRTAAFIFTGRGWGHGVGLCQTGAYGLARAGYSYTAILQKYYAGVKLQRAY